MDKKNKLTVLLFEDSSADNLFPLSVLRPVFEIKTGAFSLLEKIREFIPPKTTLSLHCRALLENYLRAENPGCGVNILPDSDCLLINGRVVISKKDFKYIMGNLPANTFISKDDSVIFAKLDKNILSLLSEIPAGEPLNIERFRGLGLNELANPDLQEIKIVSYPWDILKDFETFLNDDLKQVFKPSKKKSPGKNVRVISQEDISISVKAKIMPHVVLDASNGKIFISDNAVIEPYSYIKGPVYIGKDTLIKAGTKIYGPAVIGFGSKVAGEISGSLFHACVNKQHDGFIGNTYACPFVNFGADTVTSNLKNNYSKVRVNFKGKSIETNMQFLGTIAGDHSKFGINTMLNTGTIVGIFANVAGGGFPDKFIDSFSWLILGSDPVKYKINEALETAKTVMARRHIELKPEYEELIRKVY